MAGQPEAACLPLLLPPAPPPPEPTRPARPSRPGAAAGGLAGRFPGGARLPHHLGGPNSHRFVGGAAATAAHPPAVRLVGVGREASPVTAAVPVAFPLCGGGVDAPTSTPLTEEAARTGLGMVVGDETGRLTLLAPPLVGVAAAPAGRPSGGGSGSPPLPPRPLLARSSTWPPRPRSTWAQAR